MSRMMHLALALVLGLGSAFAATSDWQGDDGANPTFWDVAANWQGGIPAASDDVVFTHTGTAAGSISATVSLHGADRTVATVVFNNHKNIAISGGNVLTISGAGGDDLTVSGGSHTMACGVALGASADSIVIAAGATLVMSGDLALGANTTIDVGTGGTLTISGAISGAFNLIKTGAGTLIVSGNNSYTGTTTVSAGTLQLSSSGGLSGTSSVTVDGSGVLSLSGNVFPAAKALTLNSTTVPSLTSVTGFNVWSGTVTLARTSTISSLAGTMVIGGALSNPGFTLLTAGAGDMIISGAISGSGGLTKGGSGTLSLPGANTYTGATSIGVGALVVQSATALGDDGATASSTTVSSGATLILDGSHTLSSRESLTINGSGSGSGAVQVRSGSPLISGSLTLGSASSVAVLNSGSILTVSGLVTSSTGLTTQGAGVLLLSNSGNSAAASGGVTVSSGTLRLGAGTALPNGSLAVNGTLDLNGMSPTVSGALSGSGSITCGTASPSVLTVAAGGSFTGAITNGSGTVGLTVGVGTLVLNGASTYTGATTINSGAALTVAGDGDCDGTSITIGGGGSLNLSGGITLGAAVTLANGAANAITGLSGANTLGGVLTIAQASNYPVISATSGSLSISQGTAASGTPVGLTVSGAGNVTFVGSLNLGASGTRAVSMTGTGTLTVTSATIGSFALYSGTLAFANSTPFGSSSLTIYGGTLAPQNASLTIANPVFFYGDCTIDTGSGDGLAFSGNASVGPAAANVSRTITIDDGDDVVEDSTVTISGALLGEGTTSTELVKGGKDILSLAGTATNTFTRLSVSRGRMVTATDNRLPSGSQLNVLSGATASLGTHSASLSQLLGAGAVSLGASASLTVTGTSVFGGSIGGAGNLVVSGSLTLDGASSYTGTTTLSGSGTLVLRDGGINQSPTIALPTGTTLQIPAAGSGNIDRISDAADLQMSGGAFVLSAPSAETRTETVGKLSLSGATASALVVAATGSANCSLTASAATSGLVNGGSATPQINFTRTDAAGGGKAAFFIQNGYADGAAVAFARVNSSTAKYTVSSGLVATTTDWYSRTDGDWTSIQWFDAPTGGTLRAGYPGSNSDAVTVMTAVTVNTGGITCARLTLTSTGSLDGSGFVNSYLNINDGSSGTIQVTGGSPSINMLGIFSGSLPLNFDISTGATLTVKRTGAFASADYGVLFLNAMSKTGGGTLDIQVPTWPSYSGQTTITQGVMRVGFNDGSNFSRTPACSFSIVSPGILELGVDQTVNGGFSGNGMVRSGSVARTLTLGSGSFSGTLTDAATQLAVVVSGTFDLGGNNAFTGGATVNAGGNLRLVSGTAIDDGCAVTVASGGTLTVSTAEAIGPLQTSAGAIALGSGLTINQGSVSSTFSGATSGAGSLTVAGTTGTLTLSGSNLHSGGTTLSGGIASISSNANLGAEAGALVFNGGRLALAGSVNMTATNAVVDADSSTPISPTTSIPATHTTDRPISVTAAGGTIDLAASSLAMPAFSTSSGQDLAVFSSITSSAPTAAHPVLFLKTTGTQVLAGNLQAGSGADASKRVPFVVVNGGGRLVLAGTNTMASNVWRLEGSSTLALGSPAGLGAVSASGWLFTLPGSVLELDGVVAASSIYHYLSGSLLATSGDASWPGTTDAHSASVASTPTISVQSGRVLTLPGKLAGNRAWSKTGAGELRLTAGSGVSDIVGNASVLAGTLTISANDQLGNTANQLTLDGGTLSVTASVSSARGVTLGTSGGTCSVPSGSTLTLGGVVAGSGGSLTKTGAGTLILGGTNSFTAGSLVLSGVLQVTSDAGLGAAASGVTLNGGTLSTVADQTAASRGLSLGASGGTVDVAASTTLTWNGVVSGAGTLNKFAAGTLVLGGTNSGYTGAIQVQAGAVRAMTANALGTAASGTLVQNGAGLELSGTFTSAEPLQLSGAGLSSAGVLNSLTGIQTLSGAITLVQVANAAKVNVAGTLTISGVVSGAGGLLKSGVGDLTLAGTNTYTGIDTITAGRLLVSANENLGDAANGILLDGGTLVATASIAASARTVLVTANDGTINVLNSGTTLELPGLDTAVGQDLTLAGAGTLRLNMSSGGSIAGNLTSSGTAVLAKAGVGNLSITGANSAFTTTTTVIAGRLRLDGAMGGPVVVQGGVLGGTGSMGALTVQSGATVRPGDVLNQAAGVLTAASLTLRTGSILNYDLGTANDLISVGGVATIESGVQLNVLSYPAAGSFGDAVYQLINAASAPTYGGSMTASLPNGYSLSAGNSRATIGVNGNSLTLSADSSLPTVAAITSASPDGTYYQGQSFDVTVVFSKPITPSSTVSAQLILNGDTVNVPVTAGSYPATQLSGTYMIVSGDITAPGEVNATTVVLGGPITDAVGHSVSTLAATAGTLSSNKNIVIDNFVPVIEVSGATAGDTQPTPVAINTLEARYFSQTADTSTSVHVLASDQETSDPAQLIYRVLLEPSQGAVQVLISGAWGTGTTKRVVTTVTDSATQVATFTQADINAGNVRYQHTSTSGGNDAILFNVTDGDGKTSALYLLRFIVSGNAVPVISGLPASMTYVEEATHAVWLPITAVGNVTDNDSAFSDGRVSVALTNPQAGDQLDLRPDATGVTVSGSQISVGALVVGTLTRTSATSLEVRFDNPTTAGPSEAAAIINALGYRTTSMAPDPTIVRSVQISITDGSVGQTPNLYAIPVSITLYNDPPVVTVGSPIVTVPGLARTFTVSVTDPEGDTALAYSIAAPPSPQATRGALVQNTPGNFTYTPYYPSDSAVGDPLLDSFAITVADSGFPSAVSDPRRSGTAAAATSDPYTYNVRISDGGGLAPRFLAPMRMTVASSLPFSYQPQVETADGAVLTWELVDVPAQLTTALGLAPPNQASFDTVSGQLSWPAVPIPADGTGYFRFGILVTDTTSQTATLLPVMLRVGPGGAG